MQIKTVQEIGQIVRETRKNQGLTQEMLAGLCHVGVRFVGDLERGKPTCQIDKILTILQGLGVQITLDPPPAFDSDSFPGGKR